MCDGERAGFRTKYTWASSLDWDDAFRNTLNSKFTLVEWLDKVHKHENYELKQTIY